MSAASAGETSNGICTCQDSPSTVMNMSSTVGLRWSPVSGSSIHSTGVLILMPLPAASTAPPPVCIAASKPTYRCRTGWRLPEPTYDPIVMPDTVRLRPGSVSVCGAMSGVTPPGSETLPLPSIVRPLTATSSSRLPAGPRRSVPSMDKVTGVPSPPTTLSELISTSPSPNSGMLTGGVAAVPVTVNFPAPVTPTVMSHWTGVADGIVMDPTISQVWTRFCSSSTSTFVSSTPKGPRLPFHTPFFDFVGLPAVPCSCRLIVPVTPPVPTNPSVMPSAMVPPCPSVQLGGRLTSAHGMTSPVSVPWRPMSTSSWSTVSASSLSRTSSAPKVKPVEPMCDGGMMNVLPDPS